MHLFLCTKVQNVIFWKLTLFDPNLIFSNSERKSAIYDHFSKTKLLTSFQFPEIYVKFFCSVLRIHLWMDTTVVFVLPQSARARVFPFSHASCPRLPFPNLLCTAWSRCNSSQNLHYTQRSKMALTTFLFTRFLSLENPEFQRIFRLFSKKKKFRKKFQIFFIFFIKNFLAVFRGFLGILGLILNDLIY